jgi:hypothetical protein
MNQVLEARALMSGELQITLIAKWNGTPKEIAASVSEGGVSQHARRC